MKNLKISLLGLGLLSLIIIPGCSKEEASDLEGSQFSPKSSSIVYVSENDLEGNQSTQKGSAIADVGEPVIMTYGIGGSLHRKYTGCHRRFSICKVHSTPLHGENYELY